MPREAPRARARRAVTASEKRERRRTILAAAAAHLRDVGFEDFSMEVLARRLGVARGTLYRYFATREDLLLGLYEAQRASWCDALIEAVHPGMGDADFVQCFLDRTRADPLFLDLSARLESVIEHNVSVDRLIASKQLMREVMSRISGHLAACLGLDAGDAADLVISLGALLLGASQLDAGPSMEGIELPADIREMLESFSCDDVFRANARSILEGIRRRGRNAGEPR